MRLPDVFGAQSPGDLPAQRTREVLLQRPPPVLASAVLPWPPPVAPTGRSRGRPVLCAVVRQVLLRPARIGTLVLLGGLSAVGLVGAESWWFLLGVSLFHLAAAALIVLWVQTPPTSSAPGVPERPGNRVSGVRCPIPRPRRPLSEG